MLKNGLKYKNTAIVLIGTILAFTMSLSSGVREFMLALGGWGYLGGLIAGMLYVSSFTSGIGVVILFFLSKELPIIPLTIIAAIGGVIGDYTIFKMVKDDLLKELMPIYNKLGGEKVTKFFRKKYLRWIVPVAGAIIVASPLPDELGISLMGISGMKASKFLLVTFLMDVIGVFLLLSFFSLLN